MFSTPYIAGKAIDIPASALTDVLNPANQLPFAKIFMAEAQHMRAAMVHINGPTIHDEATVPFGGVKDSGSGREGGHWSIDEMTEVKWVTIQSGRHPYPF